MGLLKRIYGSLMMTAFGNKPRTKFYDADELRKGRKQNTGTSKVRHASLNRRNRRKTTKTELYLSHKARKNENCRWAKTKGFTIS